MRDPGTDGKVEAAFAEARSLFGLFFRFRPLGSVDGDPNADVRFRAQLELMLNSMRCESERKLPDDVRDFLLLACNEYAPSPKRGRRANTTRDRYIANVIAWLVAEYGIGPTRNREQHRRQYSACAIVAKVLDELGIELKETGVEDVWRRMKDQAHPDHLPEWMKLSLCDRAEIIRRLQKHAVRED